MRTAPRSPVVIPLALLIAHAACAPPPDRDVAEALRRYLSARTEMGQFSGAVLVAREGRIVLREGYGFADLEKRIPYTPDTRQPVASISKMFTALAALQLRDRGKLALDASVCSYLEDCPDAWRPVTIRHLLHHQSGIPDYEERLGIGSEPYLDLMAKPYASREILEDAKSRSLEFVPGEKFHYSNSGYVVLGYAIEAAAGEPFADLVRETILEPAGMESSGVLGSGTRPERLAFGYTSGDVGWAALLRGVSLTDGHLLRTRELALTPPQGDAWMFSTLDDLYRFSRLLEGSEVVPPRLVDEIRKPAAEGYACGWFVDRGFDRARMRHTGSLPGYLSDFIRFPDERTTIILFSNLDRARLSRIARDVTAIVLRKPYDMPVRGSVVELGDEEISRLVGTYVTGEGKTLEIRKEPDYLTAEIRGQYVAGLIPMSATEMYFPLADGRAIFTLGEDGRAGQVNMRYSGEDHLARRAAHGHTSP